MPVWGEMSGTSPAGYGEMSGFIVGTGGDVVEILAGVVDSVCVDKEGTDDANVEAAVVEVATEAAAALVVMGTIIG